LVNLKLQPLAQEEALMFGFSNDVGEAVFLDDIEHHTPRFGGFDQGGRQQQSQLMGRRIVRRRAMYKYVAPGGRVYRSEGLKGTRENLSTLLIFASKKIERFHTEILPNSDIGTGRLPL
jgi:hypothetical protein